MVVGGTTAYAECPRADLTSGDTEGALLFRTGTQDAYPLTGLGFDVRFESSTKVVARMGGCELSSGVCAWSISSTPSKPPASKSMSDSVCESERTLPVEGSRECGSTIF